MVVLDDIHTTLPDYQAALIVALSVRLCLRFSRIRKAIETSNFVET